MRRTATSAAAAKSQTRSLAVIEGVLSSRIAQAMAKAAAPKRDRCLASRRDWLAKRRAVKEGIGSWVGAGFREIGTRRGTQPKRRLLEPRFLGGRSLWRLDDAEALGPILRSCLPAERCRLKRPAPAPWSQTGRAPEGACEVALVGKAAQGGDFSQGCRATQV